MAHHNGLRLWLPKPKTFLGLMSLQTGTEIISFALLINKVTGLYGLLAILTGYALDGVQLSSYIYSVVILVLVALLIPHIRKQTPFQNLALAYLYVLDTAINTGYTTTFAVTWFVASGGNPAGDDAVQAPDTATSMVLIVVFTLVRVYFGLVVMSYARQVLQCHAEGRLEWITEDDPKSDVLSRNPFSLGSPGGEGWKGKLGRAMVFVGQDYWIGHNEDDEPFRGRRPFAVAALDYDDE